MLIIKLMSNMVKNHFSMAGMVNPRTNHLPLVSSYYQVILILVSYIIFTTKLGPSFMANRKPFQLTQLLRAYNVLQIVINLFVFIGFATSYGTHPKYNWLCMPVDKSDFSPETLKILKVSYVCYMTKIIDLLDTVFFVLRKKQNQISFLHVYHHATMVWAGFLYHNEFFGSTFTTVGYVNALVHVLMYSYYLLSTSNIKMDLEKWKPRMTQIQIIQFCYFTIKIGCAFFNNTCNLPSFWLGILFIQNLFVTAMFSNFYYKSYMMKQKKYKARNQ